MKTIAIEDLPRSFGGGIKYQYPIAELVSLPVGRAVDFGAEWPDLLEGHKPNNVATALRKALKKHSGMMGAMRQGHVYVGRAPEDDGGFSWERLDLIDGLKAALG